MTDDERERLRILSLKVENTWETLAGLRMRNTYHMTHIEKIDHGAAIYEAEIEYERALRAVRAFQARLIGH